MKHFQLDGEIRQKGNKAVIKAFRKQGLVPCNLYGLGMDNVLFTVKAKDLKMVTDTPASYIIAVDEKKPIAIEVPLNIFGHPKGVQAGGKFVQLCRKLRVSALMENLPDQLDIDVTPLGLEKRITAGDLNYDGISIISPKTTIICRVKATRAAQQAAAETAE